MLHRSLAGLVPLWSVLGSKVSAPSLFFPTAPTLLGLVLVRHRGHAMISPSFHVRPQGSYAGGVRGGFATQTEPGLGYKCWLLHDMGHNWDIRQLLKTALLLHANECFCCQVFPCLPSLLLAWLQVQAH